MGGCGSTSAIKIPHEKRYRRAIKLYQVNEVRSLTNLLNRNKCFESGESPLTLAAQEGHEAVVQSLVVSGADVNKLDNNGKGPLHIAVQLNDEETVEILLAANSNPNKYDNSNTTPLHLASENGNYRLVRRLLKAGSNVNESQRGLSPLAFAVIHGHPECVEDLLRHGADPNVLDARGNTLLHVSIRNKDPVCAQLLLDYKASPRLPSHDNTSLILLASLTGCHETLRLLIEQGGCDIRDYRQDEPPPVVAATVVGSADCLDVLLTAGADPNTVDKRGVSALQISVTSVTDPAKESFYGKYFANLYRQYSKYDIGEISHENSTRCTMSFVTGGVNTNDVWDKFAVAFPRQEGVSFEQMVLAEVLIQCFGFESVPPNTLRIFVSKLLTVREHGLLKLLYSAGVDPTWSEESMIGMSTDEQDRDLFRWIKRLRTNPRSLKDLCRQRIRRSVSWNVLYLVHKLPILSEDMKEYVCIMDTEHYSIFDEPEDNNNHSTVDSSPTESGDKVAKAPQSDLQVSNTQSVINGSVSIPDSSSIATEEPVDISSDLGNIVTQNGFPVNGIHEHTVSESLVDSTCETTGEDASLFDDDPLELLEEHHRITQNDINGMLFGHSTSIDIDIDMEKPDSGNGAICNILTGKTSVADIIIDDTLRETVT